MCVVTVPLSWRGIGNHTGFKRGGEHAVEWRYLPSVGKDTSSVKWGREKETWSFYVGAGAFEEEGHISSPTLCEGEGWLAGPDGGARAWRRTASAMPWRKPFAESFGSQAQALRAPPSLPPKNVTQQRLQDARDNLISSPLTIF
eukprot:366463-Chlamydomonas_euryale.AAC.14